MNIHTRQFNVALACVTTNRNNLTIFHVVCFWSLTFSYAQYHINTTVLIIQVLFTVQRTVHCTLEYLVWHSLCRAHSYTKLYYRYYVLPFHRMSHTLNFPQYSTVNCQSIHAIYNHDSNPILNLLLKCASYIPLNIWNRAWCMQLVTQVLFTVHSTFMMHCVLLSP